MEKEEWNKRYKNRLTSYYGIDNDITQDILDAALESGMFEDFSNDPEGAVDEEMSY